MKIITSILLLILVSAVATLSIRSHNPRVIVITPRSPPGTELGVLTYVNKNYQRKYIHVYTGGKIDMQDPAIYSTVTITAFPLSKSFFQPLQASLVWLPQFTSIRIQDNRTPSGGSVNIVGE